ncbi:MAG: DEAD/DEAH box helicase [Acidimicrobiia bacterium]|nr:DEAD/DEAH box helicase [Acidimicrobiia bacterium]
MSRIGPVDRSNRLIVPLSELDAALETIRSSATSKLELGKRFERLMCRVLLEHPGEFRDRFTQVVPWDGWEGRDGPDKGIDLVATDVDGDRWAIQTKCYRDARAPESKVDSFLAEANTASFQRRLFISTSRASPPVTKNAAKKLKGAGCRVLYHGDLAQWPVPWTDLVGDPEAPIPSILYDPHPYQQDAIDAVEAGFGAGAARGQMLLPCGTGKSVVALWIAEQIVPDNGTVLYVVPSISLLGQTMREWASQRRTVQTYVGVCSDRTAGQRGGSESADLTELSIPVTTDPDRIAEALGADRPAGGLKVVFSTYQSLDRVAKAQEMAGADFDLVICDEAHRTTGVEAEKEEGRGSSEDDGAAEAVLSDVEAKQDNGKVSPFLLVHDDKKIKARRRLYMTATPRLYTKHAKKKAQSKNVAVFSMDDLEVYGEVFYEMSFKAAVDGGWLSDYQVAIVSVDKGLYGDLADNVINAIELEHGEKIRTDDVVSMLGCWDAMANPLSRGPGLDRVTGQMNPNPDQTVKRAIAFQNTIKTSQLLASLWEPVIKEYVDRQPTGADNGRLGLEVTHVDGTTRASERATAIADLKADIPDGECRVVTNARCLSEGVDVPALDAVLFLSPRKSMVDIIQAVGRVMRTASGKERGYIILPVILPEGKTRIDDAVLRSPKFKPVWDVIRALRAHDERMDVWVNTADKGGKPPIHVIGNNGEDKDDNEDCSNGELDAPTVAQMTLPLESEIASALVEICGDRTYWATWGDDVGEVTRTVAARITRLIESRPDTAEAFGRFLAEMRQTINEHLEEGDLVDMLACHIVTLPVFNALFGSAEFASLNPVVAALNQMVDTLDRDHIRADTDSLKRLYDSVGERVRQVTDPEGRLKILLELYESFFAKGMEQETDRLGVAYTPVELVDFVLRSADQLSRHHFDKGLSDRDVHVLDPFTGTGTFINRLLTINGSDGRPLIKDEDLDRKYREEIYANEILLLAYYIAAVKIEEGYRQRRPARDYQPFPGILLCDTFNSRADDQQQLDTLSGNSRRAEQQAGQRIDVIVGNPPWSAGQKTAAEDNPNIVYPQLRERIRDTYVARSTVTLKAALFDSYKMALRWATDRIGDQGIVAFVTPNSVLDGNAESGLRACLADEYQSLYLLNLRGDARLSGEAWRREGGKMFGQSSRVGILVSVLVKHPHQPHPDRQARIWYHDIGDYLTTDQKKQALRDMGQVPTSGDGEGWQRIKPDQNHDWINQSDPTWQHLIPLGDKTTKQTALKGLAGSGTDSLTVFHIYSSGLKTNRDPYVYDWDSDGLEERTETMYNEYESQRQRVNTGEATIEQATANVKPHIIKWDSTLKDRIKRDNNAAHGKRSLREVHYRPFTKM